MYDLIGDIHGHADELIELLELLGYEKHQGSYRHRERQVIFLGDLIDRGPKIWQVLKTVRSMVEGGHALAIMGNHEFNALAFHTADRESSGEHLRRRTAKNQKQHQATLNQLEQAELDSYLEWFRSLPLWLELDGLRAVHACWDEPSLRSVAEGRQHHGGISTEFLHAASRPGKPLFTPVEIILKGKEGKLPKGITYSDKEGHVRTEFRTRWYLPADGHSYRTYALQSAELDCDLALDESIVAAATPYPSAAKPVFVGHYWLSAPRPSVLAGNVACLDYSVAKGGWLCAYRWDGEQQLSNEKFVWVKSRYLPS